MEKTCNVCGHKLTQIHMSPDLDRDVVTHMMTDAEDYPQGILVSSIK